MILIRLGRIAALKAYEMPYITVSRVEPCDFCASVPIGYGGFFILGISILDFGVDMKIRINTNALIRDIDSLKDKAAAAGKKTAKNIYKGAKALARLPESTKKAADTIMEEVRTFRERDPAAKSDTEVLLLYSGLHAILAYRVSHKLYLTEHYFSARAVSQIARFFTGIEIHPGATIGKRLFIDHGAAVVIGETTEIGNDCMIYQGVTLGGTGKDVGKRHPTLGNNVMVGAGAKVLGPMRIGDNTKVAAGAVVLTEIPDNSTAVGIPAKVVRREGVKVDELDQVHIPDPVANELKRLAEKIEELEERLEKENSERTEE